jgi:glycosyltransferase involved in cell wall biosynthesis
MPKVSVVMAVYNGAEYFDRGVATIQTQDFDDFEFIIVDDGSDDETPDLLQEAADNDRRIRVMSPGRVGFVQALNIGVNAATSPFIARQDIDDVSFPTRLRIQYDYLQNQPEVAAVGAASVMKNEERREEYVRRPPLHHQEIVRAMAQCIPIVHTLVMFRKSAWLECGGYPQFDDIEDLHLWIKMASRGWHLANTPEILGVHYVHSDSYWQRNFRYASRQRKLRGAQVKAVRTLGLPRRLLVYPFLRPVYSRMPNIVKRLVRRSVGPIRESELSEADQSTHAGSQ